MSLASTANDAFCHDRYPHGGHHFLDTVSRSSESRLRLKATKPRFTAEKPDSINIDSEAIENADRGNFWYLVQVRRQSENQGEKKRAIMSLSDWQ